MAKLLRRFDLVGLSDDYQGQLPHINEGIVGREWWGLVLAKMTVLGRNNLRDDRWRRGKTSNSKG